MSSASRPTGPALAAWYVMASRHADRALLRPPRRLLARNVLHLRHPGDGGRHDPHGHPARADAGARGDDAAWHHTARFQCVARAAVAPRGRLAGDPRLPLWGAARGRHLHPVPLRGEQAGGPHRHGLHAIRDSRAARGAAPERRAPRPSVRLRGDLRIARVDGGRLGPDSRHLLRALEDDPPRGGRDQGHDAKPHAPAQDRVLRRGGEPGRPRRAVARGDDGGAGVDRHLGIALRAGEDERRLVPPVDALDGDDAWRPLLRAGGLAAAARSACGR